MIAVVGPSGAGKDSVMGYAAEHFSSNPAVHFVRRMITRPADAGGENHDAISAEAFDELQAGGAFAVSWEAHGLKYGIPAETLLRLEQGNVLIANGSRAALPEFQSAYPNLIVVNITASPEVLAERLSSRGRETPDEIRARLQRGTPDFAPGVDVRQIDNSGKLEAAGRAFIDLISSSL